jgi:hypothetical protein
MQTESQVLLLATPKLPAHMQLQLQHLDRLVAIKQQSNHMAQRHNYTAQLPNDEIVRH